MGEPVGDGTELTVEHVVRAAGCGSRNEWLADLIAPEVADGMRTCWGYGSDPTPVFGLEESHHPR